MINYIPGDVEIVEITLHSFDDSRKFNIIPQVMIANIFESITQPVITGYLEIADGIDLLKGFPIIGEEFITIKFRTPTLTDISLKVHVTHVHSVTVQPNNKIKTYTIEFGSFELLSNVSSQITRKNSDTIDNIIRDIITNDLKSSKTIVTSKTLGIDTHILTKMTPFESIDKLRHYAISSQYKSSSFCFFEDRDQFNLITIEQLIEDGKKSASDYAYFHDENYRTSLDQVQFRDILAIEQVSESNTLEKIDSGGITNTVKKVNLITGQIEQVTYDTKQFDGIFSKTGKVPRDNTTKFNDKFSKTTSNRLLVPFTDDQDNNIGDKIGVLSGFVSKITENIINVLVHGDSSLKPGQLVNVTIGSGTSITGKSSRTVTNNFLAAKIRHIITGGRKPNYSQSIELIGNSFDTRQT